MQKYILLDSEGKNAIVSVNNTDQQEEDVKPLSDETVKQIKKSMEKMKMNRDLDHIQVKPI